MDGELGKLRFMIPLLARVGFGRLHRWVDSLYCRVHDGTEHPYRAGTPRDRRHDFTGRSRRIERPSLEDDADGPLVAEKRNTGDPQTRQLIHRARPESHLAFVAIEQ